MHEQLIRGPILNPRDDGTVEFIADGALLSDPAGKIAALGTWQRIQPTIGSHVFMRRSAGIICPPFLDAHIHIPQHPIRGRFLDGVLDSPEGKLIAGLNRNVFPAEAKCEDVQYAQQVIEDFRQDTLAHGVVGGAAYMTVHHPATLHALEMLPDTWFIGLVLMNQNCPENLRVDEANIERHLTELAEQFGRRVIVTDRFAVAVDSNLRRRCATLAQRLGLMSQTHLNEQPAEKLLVERRLYPDADSYADVYARDGLLDVRSILAHCIHMHDRELELIRRYGSTVAHCPVSNTLLASGIMPLDRIRAHGIEYALCTDVGASPTTSLLCEMTQFLKVHEGRSTRASPQEALFRCTLAPAKVLGVDDRLGSFQSGKDFSYVEIEADTDGAAAMPVNNVIRQRLLEMPQNIAPELSLAFEHLSRAQTSAAELALMTQDVNSTTARLDRKVVRVTLRGQVVWEAR